MSPTFNYSGVKPNAGGNFDLIPEGWYPWTVMDVEERESTNHEYQVKVTLGCTDGKNETVIVHYVTFKAPEDKGAGIALHFLKCLGEQYEGQFDVNPKAWIGKKLMGKVRHDEYNGQKRNKIAAISPLQPSHAPTQDDIPF